MYKELNNLYIDDNLCKRNHKILTKSIGLPGKLFYIDMNFITPIKYS